MNQDSDDRRPDDRELRPLLRDLAPDAALEERTVAALRDLGLLDEIARGSGIVGRGGTEMSDGVAADSGGAGPGGWRAGATGARWSRRLLAAAAAVILFTAGVGAGRFTAPVEAGSGDRATADGGVRQVATNPAAAGETRVVQWF